MESHFTTYHSKTTTTMESHFTTYHSVYSKCNRTSFRWEWTYSRRECSNSHGGTIDGDRCNVLTTNSTILLQTAKCGLPVLNCSSLRASSPRTCHYNCRSLDVNSTSSSLVAPHRPCCQIFANQREV